MTQHPKVSILCNTHNHEAYIASAIESFLIQKTDFPYEICIHDDASTDKTPDILRAYEAKYPELIKVIHQKENQFTQGQLIMEINSSRALGDYLAVCDGDDYWIDPLKLQKQADLLDKDPNISLVIHAYYQESVSSVHQRDLVQYYPCDKKLTLNDLLEGPGRLYGYHTYMFRRIDLKMPECFRTLRFTDLPRLLYSAAIGEVAYLKEPMAVYRRGVPNSWSVAQLKAPVVHAQNQRKLQQFYKDLDEFTDYQYSSLIQKRIAYIELLIAVRSQDKATYNQLINSPSLPHLSKQQIKRLAHDLNHPRFFAWFRSIKMKYWK